MDYFDFVHSDGSLFGKGKVIKKVLMKYKFSEENVMYIGDEVRDIEAAREAGIRVVSVAWGFNTKKALKMSNPDLIITRPVELLSLDSFLS
jgi:phosphoglycolate phosphatase